MPDVDDTDDVILAKKDLEHRAIAAGLTKGLDRRKSLKELEKIVEKAEKNQPKTYQVKTGCSVYTKHGVLYGNAAITADDLPGGQKTLDLFIEKGHIVAKVRSN